MGAASIGLLFWTLRQSGKTNRLTIHALETQIGHERPLLQISRLKIRPAKAPQRPLSLRLEWHIENQGKTACLIEKFCIYPEGIPATQAVPTTPDNAFSRVMVAYVTPGKGWGIEDKKEQERPIIGPPAPETGWIFSDAEESAIRADRRIFILGFAVYRDMAGNRWQTGFAYIMPLTAELTGEDFSPLPVISLWEDVRLPPINEQKPWIVRLSTACITAFDDIKAGRQKYRALQESREKQA